MTTLEEVRKLFPGAMYEPDPDCVGCNGTGVNVARTAKAQTMTYISKGPKPCECVFFGPRADLMRNVFRNFVAEEREGMSDD